MDQKTLMIITPYSDFGKLVRDSLIRMKSWRVNYYSTMSAVAKNIESVPALDYVLLDLDLGMERARECAFIVRDKYPLVTLIVIAKNSPPREINELLPWKVLHKPFIEEDLIEVFSDQHIRSDIIESNFLDPASVSIPIWAKNMERLLETMTNALPDLDIEKAYIFTREGILAQTAMNEIINTSELGQLIQKHLGGFVHGEILKPVKISTACFMLHGTVIAVGIILAILYNENTPFRIIRSQSRYFANRISSHDLGVTSCPELPEKVEVQSVEELDRIHKIEDESTQPNKPNRRVEPRWNTTVAHLAIENQRIDKESHLQQTKMRSVRKSRRLNGSINNTKVAAIPYEDILNRHEPELAMKSDEKDAFRKNLRVEPGRLYGIEIPAPGSLHLQQEYIARESQEAQIAGSRGKSNHNHLKMNEIDRNKLQREEKEFFPRLTSSRLSGRKSRQLFFACLLIPRFQSTALIGDVKNYLYEEMENICLSYGWRLESLIINKYYMQWIVLLPPTISPATHIKVVREITSKMILPHFSRLSKDGLLRDFWAPGQVLESGCEPITQEDIEDFIVSNRSTYYSNGLD
ncbi:MAG: hypothetical protein FJZ98_06600, partial [Chloroflexi bacterium]|nr:hypothetical protein [Chloroflexota bacterium]